jgi:hypothetical protein
VIDQNAIPDEIRRAGIDALLQALGPVGWCVSSSNTRAGTATTLAIVKSGSTMGVSTSWVAASCANRVVTGSNRDSGRQRSETKGAFKTS